MTDDIEQLDTYGFETRMIHAGSQPEPITGARQTPIFQNTGYVFHDADHAASLYNLQTFGFIYSRITNPTVAVLEERIANLENGRGATATASGHAAQLMAFFPLLEPGDEFIASNRLYGGSITQFGKTFKKFDWHCNFVDVDDPETVRKALTPKCKAIFTESLANPGSVVSDLEALSAIAREAEIPLIVDNTLATPYLCRPMDWGADIVVHSTTKFLTGNGTVVGGLVADSGRFNWIGTDKFASLSTPEPAYHGLTFYETFGDMAYTTYNHAVTLRDLGPTMAPMNAFLTLLGMETLSLRMERHCENALKVAQFLETHEAVDWVSYAGLESSPYRELSQKYTNGRGGALFTFGVKGGYEVGERVVNAVNLFSHLANIGDCRSLILHPASTTHRQLTEEQRLAAGAGPEVIRLSVGLETVEDLIADLDQALKSASKPHSRAAQ